MIYYHYYYSRNKTHCFQQKLSEMEQIQLNLEMHNKQKQSILETACSNIDKQLEEKTFMIEYPRDSAEVNSKSFCIREDPSIINDSESSCPPYLSDTSLSSTASCAAVDTSSGGLQRTNTFIDIFKQRQSRSKSMPIIQFNGQPQTDSEVVIQFKSLSCTNNSDILFTNSTLQIP